MEIHRTRAGYDAVAERYAAAFGDELAGKPLDRAMLDCLAELATTPGAVPGAVPVRAPGPVRPVADVGCGPGHVAGYLAGRGVPVLGVDLSPRMAGVAARRYPGMSCVAASMTDLPFADGAWGGAVCAYAVIHLGRDGRRRAYAEFARVIAPGGWLLLACHVSDPEHAAGQVAHAGEFLGARVDLDFRFLDPDEEAAGLRDAGFRMVSYLIREPWPDIEHQSRRAYLLVRRG